MWTLCWCRFSVVAKTVTGYTSALYCYSDEIFPVAEYICYRKVGGGTLIQHTVKYPVSLIKQHI